MHTLNFVARQDGSIEYDVITGAAAGSDGSVVLSGYTYGNWSEMNQGEEDYVAFKLDSNGDVVWTLQVIGQGLRWGERVRLRSLPILSSFVSGRIAGPTSVNELISRAEV